MESSHFLAKWLGLYLISMALLSTVRRAQFDLAVRDLWASRGMLLITGTINLLFGLAIVVSHRHSSNWRVFITMLGYLAIVKGVIRLGFPEQGKKLMEMILARGSWIRIVIFLFLGFFLFCAGLCD